MDEAHLIVVESWQDVPLKARCSACNMIFDASALIGNKQQQEGTLAALFVDHYQQVHKSSEGEREQM